MMKKTILISIILLSILYSENYFNSIAISPLSVGLGGAVITNSNAIDNILINPSALGTFNRINIEYFGGYEDNYIKEFANAYNVNYFNYINGGIVYPFESINVGLLSYNNHFDYHSYKYNFQNIAVSVGKKINETSYIGFGMNNYIVNYTDEEVIDSSPSGLPPRSYTFSYLKQYEDMRLGLSLTTSAELLFKNVEKSVTLPLTIRTGFNYIIVDNVNLYFDWEYINPILRRYSSYNQNINNILIEMENRFHFGWEKKISILKNSITIRQGIVTLSGKNSLSSLDDIIDRYIFTFGFSIKLYSFNLDIGYANPELLSSIDNEQTGLNITKYSVGLRYIY